MSSQPVDRVHPVLAVGEQISSALARAASVPVWSMSPDEQLEVLRTFARISAQVDAVRLQVLAEAETSGATAAVGAGTAADWVAVETRQVRREARSDLRLAQRLPSYPVLQAGFAAGEVGTAQARVIAAALDRLPASGELAVTAEQRGAAEQHLVGLAADHDARTLRVLGDKLLEVVAPEVAERFEGQVLEAQEARALRRTTFTMHEDEHGTCHGRFRVPALHGAMLEKMLLAHCSPVRPGGSDHRIDPDLPTDVRRGVAFTQLLESVTAQALPHSGGVGATVVVTMTLDQLTSRLETAGVCTLDTGGRISAAEARRIACRAGIIPVVLGGRSQPLDVGRKRRFHTETQRLALAIRDGGCTATGCDAPPALCQAHHDHAWASGGPTDVLTGRLLCGRHHRRLHDPAYTTTHLPDGKVTFHRRT